MGFWKKLFGLEKKVDAKFDVFAVDGDGDGKVQDGTPWERPAELTIDLDKTLEKAEALLKEVAPATAEDLEKKRKRQEAAKKAAKTRAKNRVEKVKADAERMHKQYDYHYPATPKHAPKSGRPKKSA